MWHDCLTIYYFHEILGDEARLVVHKVKGSGGITTSIFRNKICLYCVNPTAGFPGVFSCPRSCSLVPRSSRSPYDLLPTYCFALLQLFSVYTKV